MVFGSWPYPPSVLDGPADISPNGVYNFDVVPPWNNQAYVVVGVGVSITLIGALLRFYVRVFVTRRVYLDDYVALFALAAFLVFAWAMIGYIQGGGLFVHQWDIRVGNMFAEGVYLFVFSLIDCFYTIPAKAAILLEWKRIFVPRGAGASNWFYWAAWAIIAFNTASYFAAFFVVLLANRPLAFNWDLLIPGGSSPLNRKTLDLFCLGVNLTVDLATFLLPQPIIWRLKLSRARRIGLSLMFSLGLASIGIAIGRTYSTVRAVYPWPTIGDSSYTLSPLWLWYLGEATSINIVMTALSVPRAFSQDRFLGRALAIVRSWTSSLSSKLSTSRDSSFGGATWPKTFGSGSSSSRTHHHHHRLSDEGGKAISLADLKAMQAYQNSGSYYNGNNTDAIGIATGTVTNTDSGNNAHSSKIIKTVEINQEDYNGSNVSLVPTYQRQHPWTGEV
ncbi:hypothetical protein F4782DRAFT_494443 [Xylaria castorea]|nr:hypothetical protein F4782DRAFT_494443 [Xylaria castorea]